MPRAEPTFDMTPAIELRATRRAFGSVIALDSVSLTIAPGEFFALLGPSGSGKTTCLRLIAGFDQPDSGTILLDGEDVTNTPPFARNVNTVFQDYALFPHMTVAENVAYGLRVRGIAAAGRAQQAAAMLDLVQLGEFGARRPHQLSGGQRQRVALARALINRPKVLLLDEPLGALDLKLREEMQSELKGLQQRLGITFVFVTHDQGEALSMADRVAVFSQGRVEQLDTPRELYNRPQTAFVASFVGSANVVGRDAAQVLTGSGHAFAIRPELIELLAARRAGAGRVRPVQRRSRQRPLSRREQPAAREGGRAHDPGRGVVRVHRRRCPGADDGRACAACLAARIRRPAAGLTMTGRAEFSLQGRRAFYFALLLAPPLLWLGIVYLGSLFTLLLQSFYAIDEFTARIVPEFTLATYRQLLTRPAHVDIILRTLLMAVAVTMAAAVIAFPVALYMARYAGPRTKALFYVGVMLPMWTSYLVKVYAWRLILAKQGIASWGFEHLGLMGALDKALAVPVVGGPSLASSYIGMFVVFVYMWLPFMILPLAAALERVPASLLQASADLGARPGQTFRNVVLPLALPGLAAGSIFTFSLTLGDYIIPSVVGAPGYFIGMMVYQQQGTAGNLPLAAAFSVVPIVLIGLYLMLARRLGAFDAL